MLEPKKPRVAAAKTTAAKANPTESRPAPKTAEAKASAPAPAKAPAPIAVKATPAPMAPTPAPVAAKPVPAAKAPAKPPVRKPAAPVVKAAAPVVKAQETSAPAPAPKEIPVAEPVVKQPDVNPVAAEGSMNMATTTAAVENTTEKFQNAFSDVQGRTKAALEKSAKFYEELGEFTKGNIEAVIASSKVAASAAEAIGQDAAAFGKKNLEQATATFKSLAAAKSPTELLQLQSDYARSAFDSLVAESSRVSEKLVKLASDIAQPISSRFAVAAEKVKTTAL